MPRPAAAAVQVTNDIAHIFFRCDNFDLHHRLKQLGSAFGIPSRKAARASDFKRQHAGVNIVVSTVDKA